MTRKLIISTLGLITLAVTFVLWKNISIDPNKTKINDDVYLVKEGEGYSIYCKQRVKGLTRPYNVNEAIAKNVDSIIVSYKYGTLFHGLNYSTKKMDWFYIDVSSIKNIHEGFKNIQDATTSSMGEAYLDSIMKPDEAWEKYN